jgi:hypothetical protein
VHASFFAASTPLPLTANTYLRENKCYCSSVKYVKFNRVLTKCSVHVTVALPFFIVFFAKSATASYGDSWLVFASLVYVYGLKLNRMSTKCTYMSFRHHWLYQCCFHSSCLLSFFLWIFSILWRLLLSKNISQTNNKWCNICNMLVLCFINSNTRRCYLWFVFFLFSSTTFDIFLF